MADYDPKKLEEKMLGFWEKNKTFEKLMKLRKNGKTFSFMDGPPTANNPMGVHHAWGRTYKDLYLRFKGMQGFDTRRQPGFDCQGLWVEVGIEKELGFKSKKDIENYGIDKFTEKCKENVLNYVKIWIELSKKLGMWMDWEDPYLTLTDTNIEYVWYFLKKCFEKNWLYKGLKVLPWCPRCVVGSSKVLISNGSTVPIVKLKNCWKHHNVVGFNENEKKMETAPIRNYIGFQNEHVFEITTLETKRSISTTSDHPFWTKKGWKPLEKINIGDKVAVYPHEILGNIKLNKKILDEKDLKDIVSQVELERGRKRIGKYINNYRCLITSDKWIIDKRIKELRKKGYSLENIKKKILLEYNIKLSFNAIKNVGSVNRKNRTLEYVINELKDKGLLPLTTKNPKTLIICRLIGHIFGDGFFYLRKGKRKNFIIGFTGKEDDLKEIMKDLNELGFFYQPIRKRLTTSILNDRIIKGYSTEFRSNSSSLASLLLALGAPLGKKSRTGFEVPKWLLKAPKPVIREFLASYFGSEMDKIKLQGKRGFDVLRFYLNKDEKLVKEGLKFVNQISKLLKRFNIKTQKIRLGPTFIRKDGSKSVKITVTLSASKKNLLNFCKFIGYRYSKERERLARFVYEYLELRKVLEKEKVIIYDKILKLKKEGLDTKEISRILNIKKERINEILNRKSKKDIRVFNCPPFKEWLKDSTEGLSDGIVWETIENIKQIGKRNVHDINVENLHSFIVNGFITHNCGTSLSSHEVASGYKEKTHPAIYVKFPINDAEAEYLLIYTTTPWTLASNVAVAAHPDLEYVKIRIGEETLILAKNLLEKAILEKSYSTLKTMFGRELVEIQYDNPMKDLLPIQWNINGKVVLSDKYVSAEEGTGLVHIAPGHGPEDYEIGKEFQLPILSPLDESGIFNEDVGFLKGKNAKEANEIVLEKLKERGLLYREEKITHSYPCCWRCDEELIYRTGEEWFILTQEIKPKLLEEAQKVKWYPDWTMKSMTDWLTNLKDWNISRKRYYGLPLPFWFCEKCNYMEVIESKEELKKKAIRGFKELEELHRPWVDNVILKCPKCEGEMKRTDETGDCWLDAGVVFYSTLKYLEDKKYWEKWFPADFITEMHEQVRLWFYATLFVSVVLEDKVPYKSVLAHGMVVDEKMREMHKSLGNAIWADEALEKIGGDVMRWMYCLQSPGQPMPFGYTPAQDVKRTLNVLFNTVKFLQIYCEVNKYEPKKPKDFDISSQWLFSRFQTLNKNATKNLEDLKPHLAATSLEEFFLNDLSRFYGHIIREHIKPGIESESKETMLYTFYTVCLNTLKMLAPFLPFITEDLYQDFFKKFEKEESIHLCNWPVVEENLVNEKLENEMKIAREIIETTNALRHEKNIKLKYLLPSLTVDGKEEVKESVKDLNKVIEELTNVKEVKTEELTEGKEIKNGKLFLNTEITEEIKNEWLISELTRSVQENRKKLGLEIKNKIDLYLPEEELFKKNKQKIESSTGSKVSFGKILGNKYELEFENRKYEFGIKA